MRYMVLVGSVLLGVSLSAYQANSPSKIVGYALSLSKNCPYELSKVAYDKSGAVLPPKTNENKSEVMKLVTLPFLFREGRFSYEWGPPTNLETGPALTVLFSSLPSRQQLKPLEGENKYFTLGVNHLQGRVSIDQAAGQIVEIDAEVSPAVPIKKLFLKVGAIELFSVKFQQGVREGQWRPVQAVIKVKYWAITGLFAHEEYTARFTCN